MVALFQRFSTGGPGTPRGSLDIFQGVPGLDGSPIFFRGSSLRGSIALVGFEARRLWRRCARPRGALIPGPFISGSFRLDSVRRGRAHFRKSRRRRGDEAR